MTSLVSRSSRALSSKAFNLSDIGEGIAEVEVMQWFVKPGDTVEQFDKLCEVQSDKATVEITSPFVGTIVSLEYAVGDTAATGTALLQWAPAGGDAAPEAPAPEAATPAAPAAAAAPASAAAAPAAPAAATSRNGKVLATPATRALAKEHGIDLSVIPGTGRDGRVTKEDIMGYLAGGRPAVPAAAAPAAASVPTAAAAPAKPATMAPPPRAASGGPPADTTEPIKGIRKAMMTQMNLANQVPCFLLCDEVRMDNLMATRMALKPIAERYGVPKFTLMPLILKATSLALAEHPLLNSSVSEDGTTLIKKGAHNIGLAMDTPNGLLVPNVKDCASKSVLEIASELMRLQADAAAGKLGMADLKGGTFSISNIGNLGATYTGPVINLPEVAIGGLGKTRPVPKYDENGNLVKVSIMNVSWSADHRVIDGATMARFSNSWISYLENPQLMLLHL